MMRIWLAGLTLALGGMAHGHTHPGPVRVLHLGRHGVQLPFKAARPSGLAAIERAALKETGGGQIESVRPSVWVGKPVWMCTVSQGRSVWHVMVNQTTLRPVAKIIVPTRPS